MSEVRPKILLHDVPGVPVQALRELLGEAFELEVVRDAPGPGVPGVPGAAAGAAEVAITTPEHVARGQLGGFQSTQLLNAIGESLCLAGTDGTLIWGNDRFLSLPPEARARILAICAEAGAWFARRCREPDFDPSQASLRFEPTEAGRTYEIVASPMRSSPQHADASPPPRAVYEVDRIAAAVRDVTDQRLFAQRVDVIDQAGRELVGLEVEAVRKMNAMERLQLLETKIVQCAHDLLHFDHFVIRVLDRNSGKLEPVISYGLPSEALEFDIFPEREGSGITGHVAATGRSYICPDTELDERFLPGAQGARSSLTVPLRLHDRVIGTFDIESQRVNAFGDEERRFAEILARYIALALHLLDLLVVERRAVNETVTGRVEGELNEPLAALVREADELACVSGDAGAAGRAQRIRSGVETIRSRVRNVASGPQTLLGAEGFLHHPVEDPALRGKRVLVADDEARIRRVIHDVLRNRGATATACENGSVAIQRIEEAVAAGASFDLILSDIMMPDQNGYQVFAAARRLIPGVPVILMTGFGYDPHHSIVRASGEGLQCVLFKPFQVQRMLDEVHKALAIAR